MKGKASFVIEEKLKMLKGNLRDWNKNVFGILDLEMDSALKELNALDFVTGNDPVLNLEDLAIKRPMASPRCGTLFMLGKVCSIKNRGINGLRKVILTLSSFTWQ